MGLSMRKAKAVICEDFRGNVKILYKGSEMKYKTFTKPQKQYEEKGCGDEFFLRAFCFAYFLISLTHFSSSPSFDFFLTPKNAVLELRYQCQPSLSPFSEKVPVA